MYFEFFRGPNFEEKDPISHVNSSNQCSAPKDMIHVIYACLSGSMDVALSINNACRLADVFGRAGLLHSCRILKTDEGPIWK